MSSILSKETRERYKKRKNESEEDYTKRVSAMIRKNRYNQLNTVSFCVRLNRKTDADIIDWIEQLGETNASYFKRLVREDIEKCSNAQINS